MPENYYCIVNSTPYNRRWFNNQRYFTQHEWNSVLNFLKTKGIKGVVLNIGNDFVPNSPYVVNLTNKTTICESIEILKNSKGYIGVDSCLSVLAARLFDNNNLYIKSNNKHLYDWKHVYYHPKTNFNFLRRNLTGI